MKYKERFQQVREHRVKNFRTWITPTSDPDMPGEMTLHFTYNGFQDYNFSLSPAEAKKVMVTLAEALGLKLAANFTDSE